MKSSIRTFPHIPFGGYVIGGDIYEIPKIETDEQRIALTLFREADSSNSDYLAFLFFWQILEIGGTNAENFANKCVRVMPRPLAWQRSDLAALPLNGRKLGRFLSDEGRDAGNALSMAWTDYQRVRLLPRAHKSRTFAS